MKTSSSRAAAESPPASAARPDPLRILLVSFDYRPGLGGVATCAYELARALAATPGVQVRVLAPRREGDEAFDRHGHFETHRRTLPRSAVRAVLPLGRWVLQQQRAWRPHAMICLLWLPTGIAFLMLDRLVGGMPPYFVMAHGVELMESRRSLKKRVRALLAPVKRRVFRRAAGVLPVSRYTAELVRREAGVPAERIQVVFNGVDLDLFAPGARPEALAAALGTAGRTVFLTVTRLDDYKGVDRAIGALRQVVPRHPEALYLIGGTGVDEPRLRAMVDSFGLGAHVRFLGTIPVASLVDHYRLADCFVMLSREDLAAPNVEGFGIVYLEAAACGLPVIAGRSGGIPDAVQADETAWLVDPEDEDAIAAAFLAVLEDPALAAERGRKGRLRAEREFTWGHVARRVLSRVEQHVRD